VQSFGFKRGIPGDADLVFDLRMLPNPHWQNPCAARPASTPKCRLPGGTSPSPGSCSTDIAGFIERWLPAYETAAAATSPWPWAAPAASTALCTWLIGCTRTCSRHPQLQLRHRELQ
jgi:UPF0042 nucleotide-binding protein